MFAWFKRWFAPSPKSAPKYCPHGHTVVDSGTTTGARGEQGFCPGQDPPVEAHTSMQGGPTPPFVRGTGDVLFLHPGFRKGFVVRFEGVAGLFHAFTLFQHAFLNQADLPFANAGPPASVDQALARRKVLENWPGPEPSPSAEVTAIQASHLGGCVHGNTWDYSPWFALTADGLCQDLFIGGDHAIDAIPKFDGHPMILLGRARGLRTWIIDLPGDETAQIRVIRTLDIEEVESWCGQLIKAGAGLKLEGKVGCAICTHPLATLA